MGNASLMDSFPMPEKNIKGLSPGCDSPTAWPVPPKSITQKYTRSPTRTAALLTVATTEKRQITLRQMSFGTTWHSHMVVTQPSETAAELVKCYPRQPQGWSLKAPSLSEVSETEGDKTISCPFEGK